jgi:RNA polymerase sigma factor (sigma-70 family)
MAGGQLGLVLQQLRRLIGGPAADDCGDGPLLERFCRQRDETAFTALVRRHGPLVLGVCRRVLRHEQDAEDAFQATFLVLARKAGSLRRPEALGAWLYEVAYRIALKASTRAARQRQYEREAADMPGAEEGREEFRRELREVLDAELHRLPERYRRLLVLCDLQGRTHQEAARELGLPAGSLSRHLGRARELLRERLRRRGLTLSAALLAGLLAEEAAAPLSAGLVAPIVRAAVAFATGRAAAGSVPAAAATLAEGALHAMFLTRLKIVFVLLLLTGLGVTAAGVALNGAPVPPPREVPPQAEVPRDREPLDRFGDPLPRGALARLGTVRFRLSGWVEAVLFTPDGRQLLANDGGRAPTSWEVRTGRPLRRFPSLGVEHTACIALSPDGRTLATANRWQRAEVRLWDVATGRLLHQLPAPAEQGNTVVSLAFTPDGRTLVGATYDGSVQFWDPATGAESLPRLRHFEHCQLALLAPDGRTLALGNRNGTVCLYETATGREQLRCQGWPFCFSPDGRLLASGRDGGILSVWDVATGQEAGRFSGHSGDIAALAFSPDGTRLASGSQDTTALVWEMRALRRVSGPPAGQPLLKPGRN